MNHLTFFRCSRYLPVSLRGVQNKLGKSVEESGVLTPKRSVECRTHFLQIKAISYGLNTFETSPQASSINVYCRLVVVKALG